MSNFQIHELSTGTLDRDSYIVHDSEVSGNFQTRKDTAGAVADLALEVVASEYDSSSLSPYAIGSYCIYGGVLYRCTTTTTGVFDVSDWTPVLITGEYKRVRVMHKADFDLLTPEEQADGMIFVDDVDITADDVSYSAGVSVADKIDDLNNVLTPIGITQSAAWTASSASAFDTPLTGSITLDKGIYLITIATPVMTNTETLQLSTNSGSITKYSTSYPNIPTQGNNTFVIAVTSATANVQVKTGGSIANSYSYLERGGLFATRIK